MTAALDEGAFTKLKARVDEQEAALLQVSDALFTLASVVGRIVVDRGMISSSELADAIELGAEKAGGGANPVVKVFANAMRAHLPGGRFTVIEGGRPNNRMDE